MRNRGSTLTPFDPEIERIACAIKRAIREAILAQRMLVENNQLISSDPEEEITMAVVPPSTMGGYCKRTGERHVSRGFVLENPTNFDIKMQHFQV